MKKIMGLFIMLMISACTFQNGLTEPPPGAQRCGSDYECPTGTRCGFYGVDTPAVCLPGRIRTF